MLNMAPIVIPCPDADWTPAGKRTARVVGTRTRMGAGRQIRWYVAGRIFRQLRLTAANATLTEQWLLATPTR